MTPDEDRQNQSDAAPLSADEAVERLEDVQRVTEVGLSYLNLDELLAELLERVVEILRVDTAAVLLVEDDGRTLAARAAKGLEEEVERGFRLPIGRGFAGRVAATRQPVVIGDLERSDVVVVNPLLRERGIRSLLGVPLVVAGKLIGVLHVGSQTAREFRDSDVELLQLVADRVGLSIERSRLAVQDQIAQTLQRSLLPGALPRLPGLRMAARYLPASHESAVGGDWYDVIELGHRRLGLAIGDVAGHGMAAATSVGTLRSALRAYAFDTERPGEVLTKLGRFADRESTRMATMLYATLNLETWECHLARAGHPYPLLASADGSTRFITEVGGPPLAAGVTASYEDFRLILDPGDTLLLYTDGLIERRGEQTLAGESALATAAASAPEDPEHKCRAILDQLTEGIEIRDDVAMLVVQSIGLGPQFEIDVPASAVQLAGIRHLLRRWLTVNGGTDNDCAAFAIAASEACSNVIEHAYGPGEADIGISAALRANLATVTVRDGGAWREPRGENRGRGIPVMREFMDKVEIDTGDEGTTVTLQRRIGSVPR